MEIAKHLIGLSKPKMLPMHIIVFEREPTSRRGGQEISLFDLCRELAKRGHRISLVYAKSGDLLSQYQQFCDRVISIQEYVTFKANPFQSSRVFYRNIQAIPVSKNSIVYSNVYQFTLLGCALASLNHIPFVCHLRQPPQPSFGLKFGLFTRQIQQLIAVSEQTKLDWVRSGYPSNAIEVVHNGIEPDYFQPTNNPELVRVQWQISKRCKVVSYVGRLDQSKGLETLLQAIALTANSHDGIQLLIAGKPLAQKQTYQQDLKQLAIDLGIDKQITFLGHVSTPLPVYQASDLVIVPSLWSEPFGRVVLEAMSCQVPVVASRIGGIPEILFGEFEKGLFRPGDAIDLSMKLKKLLNWREDDPDLGKRCRQHVINHFNLTKTVDRVEQVLLNAIES